MNDLAVAATLPPIRRATGIDPAQIRGRRVREKIFIAFGLASTLIGLIALSLLLYDLAHEGLGRLSWDFFTNFPSRRASQAGILSAWVGSVLIILVTALIAVPLGVGAGIYLEEYAPRNWMTGIIEINVSNLAAVPSIVYGLLALALFVYGLGTGRSILTAGLTLALLILPLIIVATRESIRAVPYQQFSFWPERGECDRRGRFGRPGAGWCWAVKSDSTPSWRCSSA